MKKSLFFLGLFCLSGLGLVGWLWMTHQVPMAFSLINREVQPTKTAQHTASVQPVTLLFGGDMQFDRYIRTVAMNKGWDRLLSEKLRAFLQQADLVVANLEGPITPEPSVSVTSQMGERNNYLFTFPPETASFLREHDIRLVNIGNNHILNFGEDGVATTKEYLTEQGIAFLGSPLTSDERVAIQDIRGVKIGFVNYNQFVWQGKEKALEDIKHVQSQADCVILYTHWGKEYVKALPEMKALAHEFIDAGVDLIIGSHPHVVQEQEVYQGKTIYYSLGNFIFDQYFSPETQRGLMVEASIDPKTKTITTRDIPITIKSTGETDLVAEP